MRLSYLAALAEIVIGDAETLARAYHDIAIARREQFETEEARRRCAIAIHAVGMAADPRGFGAAYARIIGRSAAAVQSGVVPVCNRCGRDTLVRDASAQWDSDRQRWEISGVYDSTTCESCHAESNDLCVWVPREPAGPPSPKPVCAHCGSDRIIRDASARWDAEARRWVFATFHDCAFCEECEREGEDLIQWSAGDEPAPVPPADDGQ